MSDDAESIPGHAPRGTVKAIIGTVALSLVLSFVYGPLDYYSPLVYLNVLVAAVMGMAIGRCGGAILRYFCIDGKSTATLVALAGALSALWFSWLTYLWVLFDYDFEAFTMFVDPSALWEAMTFISENPVWTLTSRKGKEMTDSPALLYYGVWLAEATLFAYYSVKECRKIAAPVPEPEAEEDEQPEEEQAEEKQTDEEKQTGEEQGKKEQTAGEYADKEYADTEQAGKKQE